MNALTCETIARAGLGEPMRREGAELLYRCPRPQRHANGDAHPSLKVSPRKNTWACFVCGVGGTAWALAAFLGGFDPRAKRSVTAWLRDKGLLNGKHRATVSEAAARIVAAYDFVDESGRVLFQEVRFEPKSFKMRRPDGKGGWIWNITATRRVLYRLPEVLGAESVLVCEGPKDCEAARKLGLVATTNPNGAKSEWLPAYSECFRGKRVAVIADADETGRKHAQQVAAALFGKVESLKHLELPGAKDLSEWVERGGTREALLELISKTHEWKPQVDRFSTSEWADPKPIQAELCPVVPFDPNVLLPDVLRPWIMDEANRMPCAPDYIAAAVVVAVGSIIGARCAIKPKAKDDWLVVPNVWGGIVGLPSAKKSPAIGAALKPMDKLVAQAIEKHKAATEAFATSKTVFEARKEAIEKRVKSVAKVKDYSAENLESIVRELGEYQRGEPYAPTLRRYKTNDSTIEKLGELLRENPFGLLMLRDELVGLIVSWEREGREGDRAFFLEGWNGNHDFNTDRIGRGSIFVPNMCLSIFGGIQPDKLTGYLEQAANALANDGMLQRFQLLVYPDHCPWEYRDRLPDKQARERAFIVFERLAEFDPVELGASPADNFAKFAYFSFDQTAQDIFIEWSVDLHCVRLPAEDQPIIAQHLAKFDKLFPALALILHLVDCAATGERGPVSGAAASRAAAWCEYLESHARRCYGLLMDDGLRAALALAEKARQSKLPDGFTARDVRRNQWRSLTTDEAVQAALDWLEDECWLRAEEVGGMRAGRPTRHYFVNPKVKKNG